MHSFSFALLFFLTCYATSFPVLDDSWINNLCEECICTPNTTSSCACLEACPPTNESYFYIVNLDLFYEMSGNISHPVQVNQTMWMRVDYTYPTYAGASFSICARNKKEKSRCLKTTSILHRTFAYFEIFEEDVEIAFAASIKPKDFSVWQITNLTWIPF